ncbi:c-type cytochrome, partial [Aquifex sp.]
MRRAIALGVSALLVGGGLAKAQTKVPELTPEEMKKAAQIYFDRCAGCHGMLRGGATGPPLKPEIMRQRGADYIKWIVYNGTPGGMPDWGKQGILSKEEIELLA